MRLPYPGGSRVVLIGWTRYGRPDLMDLPAVGGNLTALAATLADPRFGTVPHGAITVLADQSRPHDAGIEITAAVNQASDLLLIYIAGHLQLAPHGEPQFPMSVAPDNPRPSVLSLNWVAHCLAQSAALHKMLILDARLDCPAEQIPDFGGILVTLCESIPGASTWIFGSADPDLYSQPGLAATAMTGAMLEAVYRVRTREPDLDLVRLHEYTAHVMRRNLMPTPRLHLSDQARMEVASAAGWLCLFANAPVEPSMVDVALLRTLRQQATDAERNYHLPAAAADAYRALVIASQRILGPDDLDTLRARQLLARWTGHAGNPAAAAREYHRLFADQQRILGADHADTVDTRNDIRYWSQR